MFPQLTPKSQPSQDFILGNSQSSLRDCILWMIVTQDCVLGYFQPSLRDSGSSLGRSYYLPLEGSGEEETFKSTNVPAA